MEWDEALSSRGHRRRKCHVGLRASPARLRAGVSASTAASVGKGPLGRDSPPIPGSPALLFLSLAESQRRPLWGNTPGCAYVQGHRGLFLSKFTGENNEKSDGQSQRGPRELPTCWALP